MVRNIYEVYATIIDANGAFNTLSGYPKRFDSRSYDGSTDKALKRARGEFYDTIGAMCKRDDRQLQTVILMQANGQVIDRQSIGMIPPDPDPEPVIPEEPEEPENPEEPEENSEEEEPA